MKLAATEYGDSVMEELGYWSFPFFSEEAAKFKRDSAFRRSGETCFVRTSGSTRRPR